MLATYLSNNSRTGYSPSQTALTTSNASSLKVAWTDTGGTGGFSQPTISNGIAYWGDWNGNEHATSAATGVDLWKTNLGTATPPVDEDCSPLEAGIVGTATIATVGSTTVVYVPGGNSTMYALATPPPVRSCGRPTWGHPRTGSCGTRRCWPTTTSTSQPRPSVTAP